jgi:hypothetical protein
MPLPEYEAAGTVVDGTVAVVDATPGSGGPESETKLVLRSLAEEHEADLRIRTFVEDLDAKLTPQDEPLRKRPVEPKDQPGFG